MTEEEAAAKLCALLNEIEDAGHEVHYASHTSLLWTGDVAIAAPPCEGEPWEVRL